MVDIPASNLKKEITKILFDQGFILSYKFEDEKGPQGTIKIALKYDKLTKDPVIKRMQRISKPGLRVYVNSQQSPKILDDLGIAILSTSKGVMTNLKARKLGIGGEVLCYIW